MVCKTCKVVINLQMGLSFATDTNDKKTINKIIVKLLEISKETGKEILSGDLSDGNYSEVVLGRGK